MRDDRPDDPAVAQAMNSYQITVVVVPTKVQVEAGGLTMLMLTLADVTESRGWKITDAFVREVREDDPALEET